MPRVGVPLVGRRAELERLRAALKRAAAGTASSVLLSGDAGVGKSRLISELSAHAAEQDALVLLGGCIDIAEDSLPYLPFADALQPLASSAEPELAAVVQAHPALRRLLPQQPTGPFEPGAGEGAVEQEMRRGAFSAQDLGQLQLFEAVLSALVELSRSRLVVLVIEDLHWADSSTRDLLSFLLARLREQRLLIVVSYRADDVHRTHPLRRLLAQLARLPSVERIELAPFGEADAVQFVDKLADAPMEERLVASIVERAEGNAFFMEELVASCLECEGVPSALVDVLLSRVERLSPTAQQVVRAASVAERGAAHQALAEVMGLPEAGLDEALREAVQHNVLVINDGEHYAFRHALLREAVYEDLLPGERARMHAAYAKRLVGKTGGKQARLLAYHSLESNDLPTALAASVVAADEAEARGAPASALRSVEQALRVWDSVPPEQRPAGIDELRLLDMAAVLAGRSGEVDRAISYARSMTEAIDSGRLDVDDHRRKARMWRRLAQALYAKDATFWEAPDVIERAWRLVAEDEPSETKAWVQVTRSAILRALGSAEEALSSARSAIADAKAVGAAGAEADALVALAVLIEVGGDIAGSRERLREARRSAEQAGALGVELRARFYLALSYYDQGQLTEALAEYTAGAARAAETGLTWSEIGTELHAQWLQAMYVLGDWDQVSEEVAKYTGPPTVGAGRLRAITALVAVARGDFAAAERQVDDLRAQWHTDGQIAVSAIAGGAALASWRGEHELAIERVREGFDWLKELPLTTLAGIRLGALGIAAAADRADQARLAADASATEAAVAAGDDFYQRVRDAFEHGQPRSGTMGPEGLAWLARAEAEYSRLRAESDPALWGKAVHAFDYGAVYQQSICRWRHADALLADGSAAAAADELLEAHANAERLGAVPLAKAIAELARRARVVLPGEEPSATPQQDPLTARERAVLEQVALGRTNRQVGETLYISEKTVSVHLSRVMAKLGARRRTEAVAMAFEQGWLQRP
jgi:DNA-binding CsgD family transcriptional regulator